MSVCECPLCGREFTTLGAFDRHQDVDYERTPNVRCTDPATAGLHQDSRGRWRTPQDARGSLRLANLTASRGRAHTSGTPPAGTPPSATVP